MRKLTQDESLSYWKSIHSQTKSNLKAVCFPDRSHSFNRFFDRIQKFAVKRCLRRLGISLKGKTLLDLGCGRGRWLDFYAAQGARVTGIDISSDANEICRKMNFNVYQGSIDELCFADGSFDFVNSVTVIQHVLPKNQERATKEVQRVLKPGGFVLLLENTSQDSSWHVWGMAVPKWTALFNECQRIFAENHYFVPLFRLLWNIPVVKSKAAIRNSLEIIMLPGSYILEYLLMRKSFGKLGTAGLQHVMVFEKRAEDGRS
jgi:ubiquinone/menaquinone biosynthesis C-methylase UbiE